MVVVNINGKQIYLNQTIKENLDYAYPKIMSGKYKFLAIVDGRSGYGKSTLVSQLAYYMSRGKLTLDNYCFNKKQALDALTSSKPGTNIVIDEAFSVANKRTSKGQENMDFLAEIQKMRFNKIMLWIILPSIYDLDKNLILSFCDLFLHVYGKPFGSKGNFAAYDPDGIKKLWLYCRQSLDYKKFEAPPNFYGSFTSYFPLDVEEYENKKRNSKVSDDEKPIVNKYLAQRDTMIYNFYKSGTSVKDLAKAVGVTTECIYQIISDINQKGLPVIQKYQKWKK